MRGFLTLLTTAMLLTVAVPAFADHEGVPHQHCGREKTCTDVPAGEMACTPGTGKANDLAVVVGAADSGEFQLKATGVNSAGKNACKFEIRVDASQIQFNEGFSPGILAPYGGASNTGAVACVADPGETCTASASFSWWRAAHGVTFDVPFTLHVDGLEVARGRAHYYDPPLVETIFGGPVVLP